MNTVKDRLKMKAAGKIGTVLIGFLVLTTGGARKAPAQSSYARLDSPLSVPIAIANALVTEKSHASIQATKVAVPPIRESLTTPIVQSLIEIQNDRKQVETGPTVGGAKRNILAQVGSEIRSKSTIIYIHFASQNSPRLSIDAQIESLEQERDRLFSGIEFDGIGFDQAPSNPADYLEIIAISSQNDPVRIVAPEVTRREIFLAAKNLRSKILSASHSLHSTADLKSSQRLYQWLIDPLEDHFQDWGIENLLFVLDRELETLPLAALHDGDAFLVEKYNIGVVPGSHLPTTDPRNLKNARVLAMGISEFSDTGTLPGVLLELLVIQQLKSGRFFLNESSTLKTLREEYQQQRLDIIHLATRGQLIPNAPDKSYIRFWDRKVTFEELRRAIPIDPPLELLVLSGIELSVENRGGWGLTDFALLTGAKSVLSSLTSTDDLGTLGLMSEFYYQLRHTSTKIEALCNAQNAMLRGEVYIEQGKLFGSGFPKGLVLPVELPGPGRRDFSHPYYWAGFTAIGNPW